MAYICGFVWFITIRKTLVLGIVEVWGRGFRRLGFGRGLVPRIPKKSERGTHAKSREYNKDDTIKSTG